MHAALPLSDLDAWRRGLGSGCDLLGLGPEPLPGRYLAVGAGVRLKAYGPADRRRPALLLVPAPIKQACVWDLAPGASVVRHALAAGFAPYLLEWPAAAGAGLAEYAGARLGAAAAAIEAETGQGALPVAGHSLGGTLAAIHAVLQPQRVRALILVGAPLRFSGGALETLARAGPSAAELTEGLDSVPGSWLSHAAYLAAPEVFGGGRALDALLSLLDPALLRLHLQVERWTLDELPMPRRLFVDVVDALYRENRFARGGLRLDGATAALADLRCPCLVAAEARSRVVPPAAVLPRAVPWVEDELLWYPGEIGVALDHVGLLVGPLAHRELWPRIFHWARERLAWPERREGAGWAE